MSGGDSGLVGFDEDEPVTTTRVVAQAQYLDDEPGDNDETPEGEANE